MLKIKDNVDLKECSKCHILKPLKEFNFRKDTQKYRNVCKKCLSVQHKQWYEKNKNNQYVYTAKITKNSDITFNGENIKINGTNITIKRDDIITHNSF